MSGNGMTDTTFSKQINFWGRLTVGIGLILSIGAPIYLFVVYDLFPGWGAIFASLGAIAIIYAANWVVEPATYFPMLGVAGTYQAWLVGNISNKLLPAAITAQGATDTKPGTKRAELISVAAMSGAVVVHLVSMILIVALFGNWIVANIPEWIANTFAYILPAIVGAVFVQLAFALKDWLATVVATVVGIFAVFFFAPAVPALAALAMPMVVIGAVLAGLYNGSRRAKKEGIQVERSSVSEM